MSMNIAINRYTYTRHNYENTIVLLNVEQQDSALSEEKDVNIIIDYQDCCPDSQFLKKLADKQNIKRIYCTNLNYNHDKCEYLPLGTGLWSFDFSDIYPEMIQIGLGTDVVDIGKYLIHIRSQKQYKDRKKLISLDFYNGHSNAFLDNPAKRNVFESRKKYFEHFIDNDYGDWELYYSENRTTVGKNWKTIKEGVFVISPPGNGIDCHRTWEALVLGLIPIVLRTDVLYDDIIQRLGGKVVNDYSEVTVEKLDEWASGEYNVELAQDLTSEYWINRCSTL